jgi:dissimilatory sulfite reductase (desulfoviridin) alpha/beta subunit
LDADVVIAAHVATLACTVAVIDTAGFADTSINAQFDAEVVTPAHVLTFTSPTAMVFCIAMSLADVVTPAQVATSTEPTVTLTAISLAEVVTPAHRVTLAPLIVFQIATLVDPLDAPSH